MQSFSVLAAFAAMVFASGAACAEPQTSPQGATPSARAIAWRCDGEQCGGFNPNPPSTAALLRECEKVVAIVGPVSRYASRGRELPAHELGLCNRYAARTPLIDQ